jgi:hypothetical protein
VFFIWVLIDIDQETGAELNLFIVAAVLPPELFYLVTHAGMFGIELIRKCGISSHSVGMRH